MDGQPGHIDQIKQINAGAVYRLIDQCGPISRIELSKRAQLAPASITKIVRELLEAHLVQETEYQEVGSRGRPAVGLILDTAAWHFLCARIGRGSITLTLRDLSTNVVAEDTVDLPAQSELPFLQRVIYEIDQFFNRHQQKLERLTAIAITMPGIIHSSSGVVHRMPFYADVRDVPLGPALSEHTGLPVFLQHDVCAWTMAESLFGASKDSQNVIQIVIDHNVGAGVITDGHLLNTRRHSVVEIGHTQVDPYGKLCYCGNHGCLETVAGLDNILTLAQQRLPLSPQSLLHHQPLTVENLCAAANMGDRLARDIINGVGYNVGRIVAIMVNLFNPDKILIGSPLNQSCDILHPTIQTCIQQQSLHDYSKDLVVESTHFHNHGTMPAAALVKDALYNGALLVQLLQG
ncbi:transcriptional regulator of PTS gene [Enterobacillus tribolii]|uniref:Transcriptional regulator of PTS protein n=1 Tax=Enterobacillus tribolii TaxID=1487935 RepID=A0A370R3Z1_9GAMM|nr:ROK family transcriptional regulator [Enterobacillus tribolii]RDK97148.1 transcriptional regulator of PTS gene [Enterobacillus tribolii]